MSKKKYTLHIGHDEHAENPFEYDTLYRFHSFNTHHVNFTDPDELLACQYEFPEGHEDEGFQCDQMPTVHDGERISDHEWIGPEGFMLSYFEHGLCRWGLEDSMSGMPDFRWDGTQYAGFLEVIANEEDFAWYHEKTEEQREDMAARACDIYTDWCNGSVYGFVLNSRSKCDMGFDHDTDEVHESLWGFYGTDDMIGEIKALIEHYGIKEKNLKIEDDYGILSYSKPLFEKPLDKEPVSL